MIVKMKKVVFLCLESDRVAALEKLRELGIVHVDHAVRVESKDVSALERTRSESARAANVLASFRGRGRPPKRLSGKDVLRRTSELLTRQTALEKDRDNLKREIDLLAPWGDFRPELVTELAQNGIQVLFCTTWKAQYEKLEIPETTIKVLVNCLRDKCYFLLISRERLDDTRYPVIAPPSHSLSVLYRKLDAVSGELTEIATKLEKLSRSRGALRKYSGDLAAEYEFASTRDGMASDGAVAYLTGYAPAEDMALLTEEAHRNGWGLISDDPAPDDLRVPTYIKKPRWLKIIDPLFDFIGITPGYRENDVSVFFLIAFPIFFGLLIGDAGYGMLFIVTAVLCKSLFRGRKAAQMALNLLILLSCFSVLWGLLTGSCFGLPRTALPWWLAGPDFLADPANSPAAVELARKLHIADPGELKGKFVQWLCFLLAALHLSSARLFKCLTEIRRWRSWGNLGWALLIWGNFFTAVNLIVFPGTFPRLPGFILYGVGVLLIVTTISASAALNLPFALIGSFMDVLSYIRLFAVGLASVYVASCFNSMGKMVLDALPKAWFILGLAGLILVVTLGHTLNILLGFMGVLVHAVRLNTLEFSNHIEMQWTGIPYRPFAKKRK